MVVLHLTWSNTMGTLCTITHGEGGDNDAVSPSLWALVTQMPAASGVPKKSSIWDQGHIVIAAVKDWKWCLQHGLYFTFFFLVWLFHFAS